MPLHWPKIDHNFVPEYQVSGVPFVTSSQPGEINGSVVAQVDFPFVTRWLQITNWGDGTLKFGFTEAGVNGVGASVSGSASEQSADHSNYYILSGSGTEGDSMSAQSTARLELRCKRLFIGAAGGSSGFSIVAGLTSAPDFVELSGSQGYVGVG